MAVEHILLEDHEPGHLSGLRFVANKQLADSAKRKLRQAAIPDPRTEIGKNMQHILEASEDQFSLNECGEIHWKEMKIASLEAGASLLTPTILLLAIEELDAGLQKAVQEKLQSWLQGQINEKLKPLVSLQEKVALPVASDISDKNRQPQEDKVAQSSAKEQQVQKVQARHTQEIREMTGLSAAARGIGCQLLENFGAMERRSIALELGALDQPQRKGLRQCGVRFGEFSLFMPFLLRPASASLLAVLRMLVLQAPDKEKTAYIAPPGLTSFAAPKEISDGSLHAAGFRNCSGRAIRLDMLERLGEEIRKARASAEKGAFHPTLEMVALLGCSKPDLTDILSSLGYSLVQIAKDETGEVDELGSLWQARPPARQPATRQNRPNSMTGKTASGKDGAHSNAKQQKKIHPKRVKKQQKKIDPDSPFAVLKELELRKK